MTILWEVSYHTTNCYKGLQAFTNNGPSDLKKPSMSVSGLSTNFFEIHVSAFNKHILSIFEISNLDFL